MIIFQNCSLIMCKLCLFIYLVTKSFYVNQAQAIKPIKMLLPLKFVIPMKMIARVPCVSVNNHVGANFFGAQHFHE